MLGAASLDTSAALTTDGRWTDMKILSFGAGMQSTALALMSCENAIRKTNPYPLVPIYDAVIFCDLGLEPTWVKEQMEFTRRSCESAGIFFKVLETPLYHDYIRATPNGHIY